MTSQHDRDSRELRELCAQRDAARATVRQQAERIAELEGRVHTCGPTCSKAGCINRRVTAERDRLRAEVERLRADAEWWHEVLGSAGPDLLVLAKKWDSNEAEKIVKAAAQRAILALRPQAVPMTPEQMRTLVVECGYDHASSQERADFINGVRTGERWHGITAQGAQGGEAQS